MTEHSFSLVPFPDPNLPDIHITGTLAREHNVLAAHLSLTGRTRDIHFPPVSSSPTRKSELWMATCFEFFLAVLNEPPYWEFNLSPSGDWNVFRMEAYRRVGFREEKLIEQLPFDVKHDMGCFSIDCRVDLSPILQPEKQVQAGVTSVIQDQAGHETYWALVHPRPQADFHLREGFTIHP